MQRRAKISAAAVALLGAVLACDDALLYQPEPLEPQYATVAPVCSVPATIYPGNPGGGTITNNALGGFTIRGTAGDDVINAGNGIDSIFGLGGNDIMCGRGGNDVFIGGPGEDVMFGGVGTDVADYSTAVGGVRVSTAGTRSHGSDAEGDRLATIENIIGTPRADNLSGDEFANVLTGGGGNDRFEGFGGADVIEGGSGLDEVFFTNAPGMVTADLGTGTGRRGHAAGDTYSSIENLLGSAYGDTLIGNSLENRITGMEGADVIRAGDGNDKIYGGVGNDRLFGEGGNDVIEANTGTNAINGGTGTDVAIANCQDAVTEVESVTAEACPASATTTLLGADSVLIRADNVGSSIVTIQLKDEFGNALTEGGIDVLVYTTVGTLSDGTTTGTSIPATDMLDGTYRVTLIGGASAGTAVIKAVIDNDTTPDNATVLVSLGRSNVWTGNVNTDWTNPGNFNTGFAATTADTVLVPGDRPNYPVFTQNHSLSQIDIETGASVAGNINLSAFDFTVRGHIRAHPLGFLGTGRVIGAGLGELMGDFRNLRIIETGRYSMIANVNITGGRLVVQGGRLRNEKFRLRVRPS